MNNCLFCKIINKNIPAEIIYENEHVLAFRDINPKAPVHILIIPKKHIETLMDIKPEDKDLISEIYMAAIKVARDEGVSSSGFRMVQNCNADGGQEVFHIHFHLLGGRKMTWPPG